MIGGGLLGLEAARGLLNHGCEVHVVHLGGASDGRSSSTRPAGAILQAAHGEAGRQRASAEDSPPRSWATDRVTGLRVQGRRDARLRHGGGRRRHPAQCGDRRARRPDGRARHRGRRPDALGRRSDVYVGRRMRAASRPGLRPGGAAVGAGARCSPTTSPARNHARRLSRLEARHQAEGDGRRTGLDGHHRAAGDARRGRSSSPNPSAAPTRS